MLLQFCEAYGNYLRSFNATTGTVEDEPEAQAGVGFNGEVSSEIMRVMRFEHVEEKRIASAVAEIVDVTDTEEWKREADFNRASQLRYQGDAKRREGSDVNRGGHPS